MKRKFLLLGAVFLFLSLVMATNGFSYTITSTVKGDTTYADTDAGYLDTLVGWTTKNDIGNSGVTTETTWVNSIINPDDTATYQIKDEPATLYLTNVNDVYAVYLETPPESEYFLVKNTTYYALFKNLVKMEWGVFDAGSLPGAMKIGDFEVSHVTRFDGTDNGGGGGVGGDPVPEPATLMLFGFGLLGIAGVSRKMK